MQRTLMSQRVLYSPPQAAPLLPNGRRLGFVQVGNKKTPSVQCLMELGDVFRMEKRGKEGDSFAFATVVGGSFEV